MIHIVIEKRHLFFMVLAMIPVVLFAQYFPLRLMPDEIRLTAIEGSRVVTQTTGGASTVVELVIGDWTISESSGNLVFAKSGVTQATLSDDGLQVENLGVNVAPADGGYKGFIAASVDSTWLYGTDIYTASPATDLGILTGDGGAGVYTYTHSGVVGKLQTGSVVAYNGCLAIKFSHTDYTAARFPYGISATGFNWDSGDVSFIDVSGASGTANSLDSVVYQASNMKWTGTGAFYNAYIEAFTELRSDGKFRVKAVGGAGTPSSGYVYVWSNNGSDDDLHATYDNGKSNIFSTCPD